MYEYNYSHYFHHNVPVSLSYVLFLCEHITKISGEDTNWPVGYVLISNTNF